MHRNQVAILLILAVTTLSYAKGPPEDRGQAKTYVATLDALNASGVTGAAQISVKGKQMDVLLEVRGFEPGRVHPQHIHGFNMPKEKSVCPPPEADANGDGIIEISEGGPFFGPILVNLLPFDQVDAEGNLTFSATFTIEPELLKPLHFRTIVLHGLTVGDAYVPSLPVACGQIEKIVGHFEDDD